MHDYRARHEGRRRRLLRGTRWLFLVSLAVLVVSGVALWQELAGKRGASLSDDPDDGCFGCYLLLMPLMSISLVTTVTTGILYCRHARALRTGLVAPRAPEDPGSAGT